MILDDCKNYKAYYMFIPKLEAGLKFIQEIQGLSAGRYDGNGMFAIVEEGITGKFNEKRFEAHKKYIDIQILLKGEEKIAWENIDNLRITTAYNPDKDIAFYTGEGSEINIKENMFYIQFPQDGHKCGGKTTAVGTEYKKIILKLPVESC
ncbi:MAG: DUF386 domain-containing protein [Anaerolineaceae bacterium]|nr:MAG: DUF386 domain-containing protein [Anaerolineaceae bacterium]